MNQSDSSREALADFSQQPKLLRTGKNEQPGVSVLVYDTLHIRKKFRATLDLVEHRSLGVILQESSWVVRGKFALVGVFERHISLIGKHLPRQGGLA